MDSLGERYAIPSFAALTLIEGASPPSLIEAEEALLGPSATPDRRKAFRLGRHAAHQALREIGHDSSPILAGVSGEPIWPDGVTGSITNKPDVAAAMVGPLSDCRALGLDLERLQPVTEIEGLILRPEEISLLSALNQPQRERAVVATFAAKEAIFKAFFPLVGEVFGFTAASLTPRVGGFEARLVEKVHPDYPSSRCFHVETRWVGDLVLSWLILR